MSENAQKEAQKNLEELALKRKERINALKRKREGDKPNEETPVNSNTSDLVLPTPKFRSYKPQDEKFNEFVLADTAPGDVISEIKGHLDSAKSEIVIDQLDIATLAPRKPDWDLKRDVARKLEILERRTQKAIAELIRDRLKERQENLADIISVDIK